MVTASVDDTWQLSWWILSQGNGIEITEPKSLRNKIVSDLRDALDQYDC